MEGKLLQHIMKKKRTIGNPAIVLVQNIHIVTILFGCEREYVWPYHSTQDDAIHLHFHRNGRA